jgi:hypothetical protein
MAMTIQQILGTDSAREFLRRYPPKAKPDRPRCVFCQGKVKPPSDGRFYLPVCEKCRKGANP